MTIHIRELRFSTIIGLLAEERIQEQEVIVDAAIDYDYRPGNYLDYAQIVQTIKTHLRDKKYELLEEALLGLEQSLRHNYPMIGSLSLQITKPHILPDAQVGLSYHSDPSEFSAKR